MSATITLPRGVGLCHLPQPFRLQRGGELDGAVLAYQRTGQHRGPVVAVLGGISADRDVRTWWGGVVGDGLAIDTARCQVLGIDWLGGAGCSTAPAAGEAFPPVATADQADALARVLDALGIDRLHALVGSSYGGMVGLQFAARHGHRLERLCVLAAADRSHAQARAWRAVQRGIVELGLRTGTGREALALARALAMTTYRSPVELDARFPATGGPTVQSWLAARGAAFAARFRPEQFLCLSASIDDHAVDAARVRVPTTLVGFSSDQLVPLADVARLARALPRLRRFAAIDTPYGHDGFLKAAGALAPVVQEVLA